MQSLLDEKKKIEEDIAATAAVKALRKQEAKEQAKIIQEARLLREKKFRAILELTSKKLYQKALVALNEVLEEDTDNADFLCHRSILLLQLHQLGVEAEVWLEAVPVTVDGLLLLRHLPGAQQRGHQLHPQVLLLLHVLPLQLLHPLLQNIHFRGVSARRVCEKLLKF